MHGPGRAGDDLVQGPRRPLATASKMARMDVRFEWGARGLADMLPHVGAVVIVDVLSFSTCVDVATSRGALIYPAEVPGLDADRAGRRGAGRYSLSPGTFGSCHAGERIVLPSPNGGALSLACGERTVFTACLRNASAVARAAVATGSAIGVLAAGERWPDDSLRPALEDLLGAGAVIRAISGSKTPEAQAATAAFDALAADLLGAISASPSGSELTGRGYFDDVATAAQIDVSFTVPRLANGAFTDTATTSSRE